MKDSDTHHIVTPNLTEDEIAEARRALEDLAGALGRISASACHKLGIRFDMDEPEVAREVMKMTFEALFLTSPKISGQAGKGRKAKAG